METRRLELGRPTPDGLIGAVLVRDLAVGSDRWRKGRRLTEDDLARLADPASVTGRAGRAPGPSAVSVIVLGPDDVHEDAAAIRLASDVAGPGTALRPPSESRVDVVALADGVLRVRIAGLERLDSVDPVAVFTLYDGQVVRAGQVVASVKIGPHAVAAAVLDEAARRARRSWPIVQVALFQPRRFGVVVHEAMPAAARERFESVMRSRVAGLRSELVALRYVAGDVDEIAAALAPLVRGPARADIVLTAGAGSTDPSDPFYGAIERLGGRVVRHGVPAHPGSMLWLARVGRVDILGLPSCGAYSRATAADLLLPRMVAGERAGPRLAASLGHGGILSRAMRFRFPEYARGLETAPTTERATTDEAPGAKLAPMDDEG